MPESLSALEPGALFGIGVLCGVLAGFLAAARRPPSAALGAALGAVEPRLSAVEQRLLALEHSLAALEHTISTWRDEARATLEAASHGAQESLLAEHPLDLALRHVKAGMSIEECVALSGVERTAVELLVALHRPLDA